MMLFTEIAKALQVQLQANMPQIRVVLKKNPAMAYTLITKLGGAYICKVSRVFNATAPYDFDDDANARFGCI